MTIILPFAVSAILIIIQKRASRIAWGFTAFGFALLFLALLYISLIEFDTGFTRLEPTITGFQCAANPSEYGINESYLWKCSMFTPGSLAEACAIAPYNFNMELSECHKFIPPQLNREGRLGYLNMAIELFGFVVKPELSIGDIGRLPL